MKGRIFYSCLLVWLCLFGLTSRSLGQTITSVTFPAAPICPGSGLIITFTTSASFASGNMFTAYLSDVTGFSYTTIIGTVIGRASGTINATIPASAAVGSGYRIQVRSSTGTPIASTVSLNTLTLSRPAAPGVTSPALLYCEGDAAPALVATPASGGTLNWYGTNQTGSTASGSPTIPGTTAAAIGNTIYYVSQTVSGCESSRAAITVTVKDKPNAPGTGALTYCIGQAANALTATPVPGATLNWYGTNASGGTAASLPPTPSTTSVGTTTYYVSQSLNGCESPRAGLAVTVNSPPAAPTVPAALTYCEGAGALALSATPIAGATLKWYGTAATGGSASTTPTTPSTSQAGTLNYYVSQTANGCESPRIAVPVTVRASPSAPAFTAVPAYCQNQTAAALVATPIAGATLKWYGTAATGGSASTTPTTPSTSQAGTFNYYVSQTANGCEGPRVAIPVTVNATPTTPGVASPIIACQNRAGYALTATPSTNGTLKWYGTAATGGTPTSTPPALSTTALGSTTYYVSQSVNGCEGARASLTVTVNAIPAGPTVAAPTAYCEGTVALALAATPSAGGTLRWYGTSQTGGTGLATPTVPNTTAAAIGSTTYYVTQIVNGCESDRTGISVQVKDTPNAPVTSAIDFCQGTGIPTLSATLIANATPNWYTNSSGGPSSTTAPIPNNTTVATTVYYVSQTLNNCEGPRAALPVRVKAIPSAPGVNPISFCNNSQAQQLTANGVNLKWYDTSDNALNNPPTPNTGNVGNQVYKVSQTTEGCEGPKASLIVVINALPGQPGVSNITYCQTQQDQTPQNVTSLDASGQNLKWYYAANGPSSTNAPTPSIAQAGTQVYYVSQTVNNCEGAKATIQVTITTPATPTISKPVVIYCINDNAVPLEAVGETGSQLKWIDPFGRVTSNAPTPSTQNTNIQPDGDPFYVFQISSNGCYSARSTIRVIVNTIPTLSLLAPTTNVNLGQKAPLQLKFTGSGPYSYSITGGYSGTTRSDTTISVLPRGITTYQVITVTNGCGIGLPGNPATAIISVRVPTVSTSALTTSTLCAGTSLAVPFATTGNFNSGNTFRIEMVSLADTTKKYDVSATANSSPISGPLPLTLASGQYYVRVKADNPEIGITGSNSPTLLTVRSLPTATLTGTQDSYEGMPVNLTLTFGGDGPWNVTYADSNRSYSATATTSPYVVEARPARTTTYRLIDVTNTCGTGAISGTATVTVLTLLGVDDNSLDPLVKAYPVPTETTLMVELNLPLTHEPATLSLTDLSGQPILQQTTRNRLNELNLTTQPNGMYLLRIQVGDRQTVRKVLKQ